MAGDKKRTKAQLLDEIQELRSRLTELEQIEKRYATWAESSTEVVMRFSPDLRHLFVSPSIERFWGIPAPEFIGKTHRELELSEEMFEELEGKLRRAFDIGEPLSCELEFPFHGVVRIWEWKLTPEKTNDGEVYSVTTHGRDITDRKQTTLALLDSEARYRLIAEYSTDVIWTADLDVRMTYVSPSVERLSGFTPDEFMQKSMAETMTPASFEIARQSVMTRFAAESAGERPAIRSEPLRLEYYSKDGSTVWVEVNVSYVRDEQGEMTGFVGVARDVTERMKGEEALEASRAELVRTLGATTDGIWKWNFDTNDLFFSDRYYTMLGYEPGEFPASFDLWRDLIHPDDLDLAMSRAAKYLESKPEEYENEFRLRTKSGEYRWIRTRARVVERDEHGEALLMIGNHEDITDQVDADAERIKLEDQVRHSQKLESLGVLAGGIAHDFNNILVAILGNVSLALMELPKRSPLYRTLKNIETAATQAAELSDQLLSYSGKGQLLVESIDLNRVIDEMSHLIEVSISKKVTLTYNLQKEPLVVRADATQIRQVVLNLITNASEATGESGGEINVRSGTRYASREYLSETYLDEELEPGEYHFFEVEDRGCGFGEETSTRLFDPFFTTRFSGRGLGLSVVIGILRGHKGAIKVESQLGLGSTFTVLLPARGSVEDIKPHALLHNELRSWRGSGRVLIVDREEAVRDVARRSVERFGFDVLTAHEGSGAVELLRNHMEEISAVLLDGAMIRSESEAVIREIRSYGTPIPIILMSGYSEREAVVEFQDQTFDGFLHKPFVAEELGETLRKALTLGAPIESNRSDRPESTVLLVDDELSVLKTGSAILEKLGYKVLSARNGAEAVELYRKQKHLIDLVILDHMMPEMDGADTCLELQSLNPDVVVFFSSGRLKAEIAERLRSYGVAGFVEKPYTMNTMAANLNSALR